MKLKALLTCTLAATLTLSGCATTQEEKTENDKLVVGMECNYAPFNWQTPDKSETSIALGGAGYADGYDIRIANYLGKELGKEVEIKKIAWDGLIPALNAGDINVIIAGMTERKGLDFTDPYYDSEMVMIVRKSDQEYLDYTSIQDFAGKTIVGQKNTNYDYVIDQIKDVKHATPKNNVPEMLVALQKHEVDGITAEYPVATSILTSNPDLAIVRFDEGKGFDVDTTVSIGMKKGSKDSELYNQINDALKKLSQETREQWMEDAIATQPKMAE